MRQQISTYLDHAITSLLLLVVGLTPLLFLNQTTEFFEMPKLMFLTITTVVLIGLWIFSWIVKGKVSITRTPLDVPLVILAGAVIASAYFSPTKFAAIYGNFPKVHGSAVSWVTYILLYFITVSHFKNLSQIKNFLYVLYGSGFLAALVTLLSFFNLFLPFEFAKSVTFTPTGSSFSSAAFLLLLLPLPLLSLLNHNKYFPTNLSMTLVALFGVTIVLIGSVPSYVALVAAFAICLFITKPQQVKKSLPLFAIPSAIVALTFIFAYLPLGGANKLQQLEAKFPKEIQLPLSVSWKISATSFRDAPFIGTGPSSYLFNFTNYKPLEFNQLKYWAFSFDTAYNEFLQVLGTLGIVGFVALLVFCVIVINTSKKNLAFEATRQDNTHVLTPALAVSGLLTVVLLAIHATTLVSIVVTFFILAALMASQKSIREKVVEFSMGLKATTVSNKQFDLFPVLIFIVFLIAAVPAMYRLFNIISADIYHRKALLQANKNGTSTYEYLQKAERLAPYIDLYRVDMAQTNFALANALAAQKGPTEKNPKGSLTDKDKQTIQTLISQAITEGKAAVALNPRSARNVEVMAGIYRNISGVAQNALAFSLDAYGRAIRLDPLNPALRLNVGGIYYAAKNYDLAIRFFSDAVNLKPDYALAYFNLSIALRDKGDFVTASRVAEQTVAILAKDNKNSNDYKLAVKLLEDLKKKASDQKASAAQTRSALENPNLPKVNVNDLKEAPKAATPEAVKKNPNAKLPEPIPTKKVTPTPEQ